MTKLSDLLRSAADRAPVGNAKISVDDMARRVRTHRGLRGVSNGLVGAGAGALLVLGVVQPGIAAPGSSGLAPQDPPKADTGSRPETAAGDDGMSMWIAWGYCGSFPLQDYGTEGTDVVDLNVDWAGGEAVEGGSTLDFTVTVLSNADVDLTSNGPVAVVLWEGMVVSTLTSEQAEAAVALALGESQEFPVSLPLVDCFEGNALPASSYELLVSQAFLDATVDPGLEPEPVPEPTGSSTPEPSVVPDGDTAVSSDGVTTAVEPEPGMVDIMPIEGPGWDYLAVSQPIAFTVAGDPVDNPFGDYYPQPWTPPVLPDDALTPDIARELFGAHQASGTWDMAKGTSRWILPSYGQWDEDGNQVGSESWFGCSYDGTLGVSFPGASSDFPLLDVDANIPSRINVSYGWVVDNNPEVAFSVRNASEFSLPGFYGEPNRALYLVRNGRIVAEAYPTNLDPNGGVRLAATDSVSKLIAPEYQESGYLAPDGTLSGDYLWREVTGCWTEGGNTAISAGTYTVVTAQSIYLETYGAGSGPIEPMPYGSDELVKYSTEPGAATLIDPATGGGDGSYDWLELQVWTSLGTVTITTN